MFSSKDFEKCWFLYQSEGLPYNLSIEEFCLKQGVPVNEFNKWYRDTHKRIHPIQVSGVPTSETKQGASEDQAPSKESVRIAVTICMSNGVFVKRKNLSYESLLKFDALKVIPVNGGFREKQIYRIPDSAEGGTRPDYS
jgi:hypothetical protein